MRLTALVIRWVFATITSDLETHQEAEAGLELPSLLPPLSQCQDCRLVPPYEALMQRYLLEQDIFVVVVLV